MTNLMCRRCGREFEGGRFRPRKYCDDRCRYQATTDFMRGRHRGVWYRRTKGAYDHIRAAEAKLGRKLRPGERVYHDNGDKFDNRPENLLVFPSMSELMRYHHRKRRMSA